MTEYITICEIDTSKYQGLCEELIISKEVIITNKQIEHINGKKERGFEKYEKHLKNIIEDPDYIIKDLKHKDTGLVIKKIKKNIIVVLKLNTTNDKNKNSIITVWEIKDARLERYLLTHKTIYKKE